LTSSRRAIAAGAGAYIGINAAALLTAIEFGLQPALFHRADGTPLYAPFHLSHAIPTMMFAHLLVAGVVEFALTAGVIAYLQRANLPLLRINHRDGGEADVRDAARGGPRVRWRFAGIGLLVLVLLTPLGLLAPGAAFGEDAHGKGFLRHALFDGYDFTNNAHPVLGYLVSAAVGMLVIGLVVGAGFVIARRARRPVAAAGTS
jgi:cobalt/nickel transport system permease protein